jgi:hypothetical protein
VSIERAADFARSLGVLPAEALRETVSHQAIFFALFLLFLALALSQ